MSLSEREETPTHGTSERRRRRGLLLSATIVFVVASVSLIAFFGWAEVYSRQFEPNAPEITAFEIPRGIGLAPVTVKFDLRDPGAGLDEVVVRTRQRGRTKEVLRQALEGKPAARVSIDFPGEKSDLEEGVVELEIRAFDRSFWSNAATAQISLKVDFRRPRVEVLSAQHNVRQGGSQLILYRAIDEDLALSGVKLGDELFPGYPARGIDRDFSEPTIFAALFTVDNRLESVPPMQLYAEDSVGNTGGAAFYYRVAARSARNTQVTLSEEFMRQTVASIMEQNLSTLEEDSRVRGQPQLFISQRGSDERLIEQFALVNERVRLFNDRAISRLLQGPRFERMWEGPIARPVGITQVAYGDRVKYRFRDREIGSAISTGYEFGVRGATEDVFAVADGVVTFSDGFGVPGRMIALDHGMGLSSLYGSLEQAYVSRGETVRSGQRIGRVGATGLTRTPRLYFEMRVHGVPVAPEEWWESRWYHDHITAKINEVKQSLGMAVLRPIER